MIATLIFLVVYNLVCYRSLRSDKKGRRLFLACLSALALQAGTAFAQSPRTAVSFDLLEKARTADSLRRVTERQRAQLAFLQRAVKLQADSIANARARARSAPVAVETVTVKIVDTTHKVAPPVATPAKAATLPAAKAPAVIVSGLLQMWAIAGDEGYRNTYRLRRAELKVTSELSPTSKVIIAVDAAKSLSLTSGTTPSVSQSSRILQDAFISVSLPLAQTMDAGQQKLPLGFEGQQSSSALELPERTLFASDRARGGSFGDVRDIGVTLRGRVLRQVEYQLGAFNGSGEHQNEMDRNVGKTVSARVILKPTRIAGLQFGASGLTAGDSAGDKPRRDRFAAELQYRRGPALLQVEAITGRDAVVHRRGMYTHLGWTLGQLRLAARFDAWDPDVNLESTPATATERDYVLGASWLPKASRLRLNTQVMRKTFTHDLTPSSTRAIASLQAAW